MFILRSVGIAWFLKAIWRHWRDYFSYFLLILIKAIKIAENRSQFCCCNIKELYTHSLICMFYTSNLNKTTLIVLNCHMSIIPKVPLPVKRGIVVYLNIWSWQSFTCNEAAKGGLHRMLQIILSNSVFSFFSLMIYMLSLKI